eukprot:m.171758 g.171758  ORF g.171758 m.171758 type:complete len:474 (+) comp16712_c0_seq1:2787-4208(+)
MQLLSIVCFLLAAAAAIDDSPSFSIDDQGRMTIDSNNEVFIANVSIQNLSHTVKELHARLDYQIETNLQLEKQLDEELLLQDKQFRSLSQQLQALASRFKCSLFSISSASSDKLLASNGDSNDLFGISLAISNDVLVVGAHYDEAKGSRSGSAYVFEKNSTGTYVQTAQLQASDGAPSNFFGLAVAVTNFSVVVGASGNSANSGAAYVFEKNETGNYEQKDKLVGSSGISGQFGSAVAAVGDVVVVGAYRDINGAVYVFERNSSGAYVQVSKLVAHDGQPNDVFGRYLAATSNTIAVGAYGDDSFRGAVYVYEKNASGNFVYTTKLTASDGVAEDQFGFAVAVTERMIVVGAYQNNGNGAGRSGSVYVFEKNSVGSYVQVRKLVPGGNKSDSRFGYAVAATSNLIIVGAQFEGSAYAFERNATGGFEQVNTVVGSSDGQGFGNAVVASTNMVAVGDPMDDGMGTNAGAVYVYS